MEIEPSGRPVTRRLSRQPRRRGRLLARRTRSHRRRLRFGPDRPNPARQPGGGSEGPRRPRDTPGSAGPIHPTPLRGGRTFLRRGGCMPPRAGRLTRGWRVVQARKRRRLHSDRRGARIPTLTYPATPGRRDNDRFDLSARPVIDPRSCPQPRRSIPQPMSRCAPQARSLPGCSESDSWLAPRVLISIAGSDPQHRYPAASVIGVPVAPRNDHKLTWRQDLHGPNTFIKHCKL